MLNDRNFCTLWGGHLCLLVLGMLGKDRAK
jgi:hypothetical protein